MDIAIFIIIAFVALIIFGKLKGAPDPSAMSDEALVARLQSEGAWLMRYRGLPLENQNSASLKKMYDEKTAYIERIKLEIVRREKSFQAKQGEPFKRDSLFSEKADEDVISEKAFAAADAGDSDAQFLVGSAYLAGANGLPQNLQKAGAYLLKAAEQNHAFAAFVVAGLYAEGNGLSKDLTKARLWAVKAKQLDYPDADQMLMAIDAMRTAR